MLTVICKELRNWFEKDKLFGEFTISDGSIDLADTSIADGQYFRIIGSVFNDGVHKYPTNELEDEVFDGAVWLLAIPKDVIDLSETVTAWREKYEDLDSVAMSPYNSESFGGYSYSKSSRGSGGESDGTGTWQSVFASDLNRWRKI